MNLFADWFSNDFSPNDIQQGTIIQGCRALGEEEKFYLVINPACDLAQSKADYVNLISQGDLSIAVRKILSDFNLTDDDLSGVRKLNMGKFSKVQKKFRDQILGKSNHRWYFIPESYCYQTSLFVLDFQQIYSVPITETEITDLLNRRKVVIKSPFKEQIITRFYSHMTRVGAPDTFVDDLVSIIIKEVGIGLTPQSVGTGTSDEGL